MVSIILRLYVYTSVKDHTFLLKRSEHTCTLILKSSTFIVGLMTLALICVTWSRTTAQVFGVARSTGPSKDWMNGVSLFFLYAPKIKESKIKFDNMDLTNYVRHQGLQADRPWLIKDLSVITHNQTGYKVQYPCNIRSADRPDLCGGPRERRGKLIFLLTYDTSQPSWTAPLGQVRFGVAYVNSSSHCRPLGEPLITRWQLFFFRIDPEYQSKSPDRKVKVLTPWPDICTVPFPVHDPDRLNPCVDHTRRREERKRRHQYT